MIGAEAFAGWSQAARIIGLVLLEAILLYAGYGLLERLVGPRLTGLIRGD